MGVEFTIGQLARRTGLPVRTIRFWSDAGVVPATARTAAGYRLYDAAALSRVELVRTLRDLGIGLEVVRQILERATTLAQVAETHAAALDAEINTLRLRRAVLRTLAGRDGTPEEMVRMHKLARLSARERQQIIDDFVGRAFAGIDPEAPGAGIAERMRRMPAALPDDPTPEQVDAWIELAELVADDDFRERVRRMALAGARGERPPVAEDAVEHARRALADGVAPDSPQAAAILDRIVPAAERARALETLRTFTDARVERYWQLLGVLNGGPAFAPAVPAFEWLIAALTCHVRQ